MRYLPLVIAGTLLASTAAVAQPGTHSGTWTREHILEEQIHAGQIAERDLARLRAHGSLSWKEGHELERKVALGQAASRDLARLRQAQANIPH